MSPTRDAASLVEGGRRDARHVAQHSQGLSWPDGMAPPITSVPFGLVESIIGSPQRLLGRFRATHGNAR